MYSNGYSNPFGASSPYFGGGPYPSPSSYSPYGRRRMQQQESARRQQQRMAMEEEQRQRQAAAAQYERRKRAEEEDLLRRQQQRAQRNEYERRKRLEREEMARREEEELLRRRRSEMESMQRERSQNQMLRNSKKHLSETKASYPPGTIVRGADGRLYRVVEPPREERGDGNGSYSDPRQERSPSASCDEDKEHIEASVAKDKWMSESSKSCSSDSDSSDSDDNSASSDDADSNVCNKNISIAAAPAMDQTNVLGQEVVLVETVPDEEDEELREMRSVWRNRAPSPGQWIEPVEAFVG